MTKAGEVREVAWARRQRGMRAARKGWKRVEAKTRMRMSRVMLSCMEMLRGDGELVEEGGFEVMVVVVVVDVRDGCGGKWAGGRGYKRAWEGDVSIERTLQDNESELWLWEVAVVGFGENASGLESQQA